jgi:hypothetical protein
LFYDDGDKQCLDQPGSDGSSCYEQPLSDVYCFFVPMVF